MNKYRITYPNNKEVREYLSACRLHSKKSRTTKGFQSKIWKYNESFYAKRYNLSQPDYDSAYDYNKLGFFILNIKPW